MTIITPIATETPKPLASEMPVASALPVDVPALKSRQNQRPDDSCYRKDLICALSFTNVLMLIHTISYPVYRSAQRAFVCDPLVFIFYPCFVVVIGLRLRLLAHSRQKGTVSCSVEWLQLAPFADELSYQRSLLKVLHMSACTSIIALLSFGAFVVPMLLTDFAEIADLPHQTLLWDSAAVSVLAIVHVSVDCVCWTGYERV